MYTTYGAVKEFEEQSLLDP